MSENDKSAEDSRLLLVAASISSGTPVDWNQVQQWPTDQDQQAVIAELRVLQDLSRIADPSPATWGPFLIRGEIGHGSFGTVYRAYDPNLQLEVALKVIRARIPDASIDAPRALTEARLLAQINHPNVVRVYRSEQLGNEVGLAMELVEGQSFSEFVRREGPRSAREAVLVGIDICRALAAVHQAKLLHGDIKAHNVMRANDGRTVVMDFGAGKDLKRETRRDRTQITGTPLYLAPEVLAGGPPSTASDIYSLGVLLYYLSTGSYPVEGTTRTQIQRVHLEGNPRKPLREVRPDLPDVFIRAVNRALADLPQDRYQSAAEFETELNHVRHVIRDDGGRSFRGKLWLIAAAAILGIGFAAVVASRMLRPVVPASRNAVGAAPTTLRASASVMQPSANAVASPDSYRIQAALYRERDGLEIPLQDGARIGPGEKLSMQLSSSVSIHVYIVNEDDHGESYLLFPLDGQSVTNPLPGGRQHRLPGAHDGERTSWQVTSPGGREHFLIFASPAPLSQAFEQTFATLARPAVDRPVLYQRLSREALSVLRGVGGLSPSPGRGGEPLHLTQEFSAPLTGGEESARGVWVRQITLANPIK